MVKNSESQKSLSKVSWKMDTGRLARVFWGHYGGSYITLFAVVKRKHCSLVREAKVVFLKKPIKRSNSKLLTFLRGAYIINFYLVYQQLP